MRYRKPFIVAAFGFFVCSLSFLSAQQQALGQWREHYSYRNGISVSEGNGKIYCVTAGGVFSFNPSDNSIDRMSKITGLSDVEPVAAEYNSYNGALLVLYSNTNIDLIKNGKVINVSDIKRKPINGNKTINNVLFINQYAYLACGFGIVVLDTEKEEIKETYYIGANGKAINVFELATQGGSLFAATEDGIYQASVTSPSLINYSEWKKQPGLPPGIYNTINVFDNKVFANFSNNKTNNKYFQDTIYMYDGVSWSRTFLTHDNPKSIHGYANNLLISCESYVVLYDKSMSAIKYINDYGFSKSNITKDAILDGSGTIWIADDGWGLVKAKNDGSVEFYLPNGPYTNKANECKVSSGHLWVVPSSVEGYSLDGIYHYYDDTWINITRSSEKGMDTINNINVIEIDPQNPNHAFAGAFNNGLVEIDNNSIANLHNTLSTGGALQNVLGFPNFYSLRVVGLDYDEDNNLWIGLSHVTKCLSVKKNDGSWQNFNFSQFIPGTDMGKLLVNKWNQKWMIIPNGGGVLVYDDQGTYATPSSSNTKKLNGSKGNGGLPSNEIMALAEDQDGEIWVGTNKGIAVFYTPETIFTGSGWDAQQILIEQDGHVQILLETEIIKSISVDGANRKWIGTYNSGVFLMSEDGTKQIQHFTIDNSPLPSNEITSIAINNESGEVYFATSKGIVSYRSDATVGTEDFSDVYSFPNPVKENYEGPIAIRGLVKNASVKITDITGTLVYETKALGGQAIWEGKNFNGERVHTGVYLVFCSNDEGDKTYVTKILVIN